MSYISQFEHLVLANDYADAYDILLAFSGFLARNGHLARIIEMRRKLIGKLGNLMRERRNLGKLGIALHNQGLSENAQEYLHQAVRMSREADDLDSLGAHLNNLGNSYKGTRDYYEAIKHYEECQEISRSLGKVSLEESTVVNLGSTYRLIGDIPKSISMCKRAIRMSEDLEDSQRKGVALASLAESLCSAGLYKEALASVNEALDLTQNKRRVGQRLLTRGDINRLLRKYKEALQDYSSALDIAILYSNKENECFCRTNIAILQLLENKIHDALDTLSNNSLLNTRVNTFRLFLLQGVLLSRSSQMNMAKEKFIQSLNETNKLLSKTDRYTAAMYSKALTLLGLSFVSNSEADSLDYFHQSISAYESAVKNCSATGIIDEARMMLNQLEPIGTEDQLQMILAILDSKQQT